MLDLKEKQLEHVRRAMTETYEVQWEPRGSGTGIQVGFPGGHLPSALEESEQEPRQLMEVEARCAGTEALLTGKTVSTGAHFSNQRTWKLQGK